MAVGRGEEAMVHLKRAVTLFAEIDGLPDAQEPGIWKLVSWSGRSGGPAGVSPRRGPP